MALGRVRRAEALFKRVIGLNCPDDMERKARAHLFRMGLQQAEKHMQVASWSDALRLLDLLDTEVEKCSEVELEISLLDLRAKCLGKLGSWERFAMTMARLRSVVERLNERSGESIYQKKLSELERMFPDLGRPNESTNADFGSKPSGNRTTRVQRKKDRPKASG